MANAVNVNFRMDPDLKRSMEEVCAEMGLSMTTAFTILQRKSRGSTAFRLRSLLTRSTQRATSITCVRSCTTSTPVRPSSPSTT